MKKDLTRKGQAIAVDALDWIRFNPFIVQGQVLQNVRELEL